MIDKKEIFIFDFDNTIIESLPLCFSCFRIVFEKYKNIKMNDSDIESLFGGSEEDIIRSHVEEKYADEAVELFYILYENLHDHFIVQNKVFENITLLLKKLNYKGKRLAVFTGKGRKSIQISMKKLELEKYFNYIVSDDDVANSKPDSEGILKILDHYNATPSDAIFFGDSDADIISAKKANVLAVGVNWYKTRIFTISPDIISKNPLDIIYSC